MVLEQKRYKDIARMNGSLKNFHFLANEKQVVEVLVGKLGCEQMYIKQVDEKNRVPES